MALSNKDTIDTLLAYCQDNDISCVRVKVDQELDRCHFAYDSRAVRIGNFAMQVHRHGTGNSVRVYIIGAGEPYQIQDATYWHSSSYNHNPDMILSGKWDLAFDEAIDELRKLVSQHRAGLIGEALANQQSKDKAEAMRKAEVEALFSGGVK